MTGNENDPTVSNGIAPKPLDGWLHLALAWIALLFLWWGYELASALSGGALGIFPLSLTADLPPGVFPFLRWVFFDLIFAVVICVLSALCFVRFLHRSRQFPNLMIALNAVLVLALVFDTGMTYALSGPEASQSGIGLSLGKTLLAGTAAAAWIAYFQAAPRVNETFVR